MDSDHSQDRTKKKRHTKKESNQKKKIKQKKRKYSSSSNSDSTDSSTKTSSSDSKSDTLRPDENAIDKLNAICSCCYSSAHFQDIDDIFHECSICSRFYHANCHIPIIKFRCKKPNWQCTLCDDMTSISKNLGRNEDAEDLSVGTVGRKIAERILMELYCSDIYTDAFKGVKIVKGWHKMHYVLICHKSRLNEVRYNLLTNSHTFKLSNFMDDTKMVFTRSLTIFDINEPSFEVARRILKELKSLYSTWIAPPTKKYWDAY